MSLTAEDILFRWWKKKQWPDFVLLDVDDLGQEALITVSDANGLGLPIDVFVEYSSGRIEQQILSFDEALVQLKLLKKPQERLIRVELNSGREVFDDDRFNNSLGWPGLKIFPGNARGLSDDDYTLVWLPFPMLLPGEDLSANLGFNLRRYVRGGLSGLLTYTRGQARPYGYSLAYRHSTQGIGILTRAIENYRQGYRGDRLLKVQVAQSLVRENRFSLGINSALSTRETLAVSASRHLLYGLGSQLSLSLSSCQLQMNVSFTSSFGRISSFDYQKLSHLSEFSCRTGALTSTSFRFLVGTLNAYEERF